MIFISIVVLNERLSADFIWSRSESTVSSSVIPCWKVSSELSFLSSFSFPSSGVQKEIKVRIFSLFSPEILRSSISELSNFSAPILSNLSIRFEIAWACSGFSLISARKDFTIFLLLMWKVILSFRFVDWIILVSVCPSVAMISAS